MSSTVVLTAALVSHNRLVLLIHSLCPRAYLCGSADCALCLMLSLCMQPSITYEQQVGQQALCSLQFSQQVVPPPTDTKPSSKRSPSGKAAMLDEPLHTRLELQLCLQSALQTSKQDKPK